MTEAFQATSSKTYTIIRDYFVANAEKQGIYFLIHDKENGEIKKVFLDKNDLNGDYVPRKTKEDGVRLKASGIECGTKNELVVETGIWTLSGKWQSEKELPAKKYRFLLKK